MLISYTKETTAQGDISSSGKSLTPCKPQTCRASLCMHRRGSCDVFFCLILIPDRNLGSSSEQKSCQTRRRTKTGCRPSRPTTKFGAIYAAGNPRFLLGISISVLCHNHGCEGGPVVALRRTNRSSRFDWYLSDNTCLALKCLYFFAFHAL